MTGMAAHDKERVGSAADLHLDGKAVWITGASRGLGRELAFAAASAGAEVLLTARNGTGLGDVAKAIQAFGGRAEIATGSVCASDDIRAAARLAERCWGRLDVLINNAGIGGSYSPSEDVESEEWNDVLAVNLTGPFECCKVALPLLERAGGGSIVNVSSVHGHVGGRRLAPYAASKGGLELLTKCLAIEWAPRGIRVNSVAPGYLVTDMTSGLREHDHIRERLLREIPLGRFADAREVVPAVLFLAGAGSSYITGATLLVDGGWTAR